MKRLVLTISAAALLAFASRAPAQERMTEAGPTGAPITITGCVKPGIAADSYLMFNVHNSSEAAGVVPLRIVYWLDHAAGKLKPQVGHSVEVTGVIESERSGKIEVKDEKDGTAKVKVEKGADKVETRTTNPPAPVGTTGTDVVKLKVQSIRMLASSCDAR